MKQVLQYRKTQCIKGQKYDIRTYIREIKTWGTSIFKEYRSFAPAIATMLLWDNVIGCPTKVLFGISCPGCGMSRAIISLMRCDFSGAFHNHPFVFLLPAVFVLFLFSKKITKRSKKILIMLFLLIYLFIYVYRLYVEGDVVTVDIHSGMVYKFLKILFFGGE